MDDNELVTKLEEVGGAELDDEESALELEDELVV